MRWDLALSVLSRFRVLNLSDFEEFALSLLVVLVSEGINTCDIELAAERFNETTWNDLIPSDVVVTHVHKAGLCHLEIDGEALSLHQESEVVTTVVRVVYFSNLNGIISQEVVDDERKIVKAGIETKDFAIVVEELLLALHSATTERFFHVLFQRWVSNDRLGDFALSETINRDALCLRLRLTLSLLHLID